MALRRHVLGVGILVLVIFIWVGSSALIQFILHDQEFNKPFFLTYFCTSLFMVYNAGFLWKLSWRQRCQPQQRNTLDMADERQPLRQFSQPVSLVKPITGSHSAMHPGVDGGNDVPSHGGLASALPTTRHARIHSLSDHSHAHSDGLSTGNVGAGQEMNLVPSSVDSARDEVEADGEGGLPNVHPDTDEMTGDTTPFSAEPFTAKQTFLISAVICPVWFLANYAFNLSLGMTSVSSSTTLSTTSSLFTLIFAAMARVERFSFGKLGAVLLSLSGAAMISYADQSKWGGETFEGDLVALTGAAFYGLYSVLLKRKLGDESRVSMPMFFGFLGLINALCLWPLFLALDGMGWEQFRWPAPMVLLSLLANGLVGTVLSDLLWLWAVLLTSPLVATVGLSLTIPLAMLSDVLLHQKAFAVLYFIGSILVVGGFVLVNLSPKQFQRLIGGWCAEYGFTKGLSKTKGPEEIAS